jgi:hypothetical protein
MYRGYEREMFKMRVSDFILKYKESYENHMQLFFNNKLTDYEKLILEGKMIDRAIKLYDSLTKDYQTQMEDDLDEIIRIEKEYWDPKLLKEKYLK